MSSGAIAVLASTAGDSAVLAPPAVGFGAAFTIPLLIDTSRRRAEAAPQPLFQASCSGLSG
jgi:hypothetical protein